MRGSRRGSVAFAVLLAVGCDSSINPSDVSELGPPIRVAVTTKAVSLIVGQERQLSVAGSDPQVTWQSDNSATVTVSPTGLVSARAAGVAHVIVREKSAADTTTVTVLPPLDGVQFVVDTVNVAVGRSVKLVFRGVDLSGAPIDSLNFSGAEIQWRSTLASIAAVDSAGLVSALAIGRTEIVLSVDGKLDTATVNVVPVAVASVVISAPAEFSISAGSSYRVSAVAKDDEGNDLPDRPFVWSTSDGTVASISPSGLVTGIRPGSAKISVTAEGQSANFVVIVPPPPIASLTVSLAQPTIPTRQTTQAIAVARDASGNVLTGRVVTWSSLNPTVATVSSSGFVTALVEGSATIRATVESKTADVELTVVAMPPQPATANVSVMLDSIKIVAGQMTQCHFIARDAQGNVLSGKTASWISMNPAIATLSSTGVATGVSAGSVVVQATVDGITGQASLTVTNPTAPAIPNGPTPGPGVLASHDFEDGTLGPFYNPWGHGIDLVSDPANGGHGKVARLHYAGSANQDANLALLPKSTFSIGLGDSVWFRGDFLLSSNSAGTQRKLLYWEWSNDVTWGFQHPFSMVVNSFGPQMAVQNYPHQSFEPEGTSWLPVNITAGVWHTLKVQMKVNTSFAAKDGVLRVWFDDTLVFDNKTMSWTDPAWTEDPSTYKWVQWQVGQQTQNVSSAYDEYRYWDNVTFSKAPIGP